MLPVLCRRSFCIAILGALSLPLMAWASLDDSRLPILPLPVDPPDGSVLPASGGMLRWTPVPGAAEYHVFLSPDARSPLPPDGAPDTMQTIRATTERNWIDISRIPIPSPKEGTWHWAVAVREGSHFLAGPKGSFRLGRAGGSARPLIRKGASRRTAHGRRPAPVYLANGASVAPGPGKTEALSRARYGVVRFQGPIRETWSEALSLRGAEPIEYLPDDAYVVRMNRGSLEDLLSSPGVVWVAPYGASHKIARSCAAAGKGTTRAEAAILLFPGEPPEPLIARVKEEGGEVLRAGDDILHIRIESALLSVLAEENGVRWIEPHREMTLFNSDCQWVVQSDLSQVRSVWNRGLRGHGVLLSLCDSGIRTSHHMLRDPLSTITGFGDYPDHRKITAYWKADSTSLILFGDDAGSDYHGTHTATTLGGNDSTFGSSSLDGMAPEARILFVDGGGTSNVIFTPVDLGDLFQAVYQGNEGGAPRIMSNSWGFLGGGAYDYRCEQVDRFVWEHKDFLPIFSNGNGGIANSVASPAVSKNCISVGGTENGSQADQIYSVSSRGPTDDGRIKPTLCAPARLTSASGEGDAQYQTLEGTSMAAPSVAGSAALVTEYFRDGYYPSGVPFGSPGRTPSAALIKAMLVTGGENDVAGFAIPSHDIGWGRLRLEEVLYFEGEGRRLAVADDQEGLLTGDAVTYEVNVASSSEPLEVTLVWTDYPSSPAASRNLVNDLDLAITGGGTTYRGNVFSGGASVPGGTRDSLNVEECLFVESPAPGTWLIQVEAVAVPFGPQPFALVVTGALDVAAATVTLDRTVYGGADTLVVQVEDSGAASPLWATVCSETEAEPESLLLAGAGGFFQEILPTATTPPLHGDGLLSVSHGDSIHVLYEDSSPLGTRSAGAAVSFAGPVLQPPSVPAAGARTAKVRWETSTPSDSRVLFGLEPGATNDSVWSADLVLSHELELTGLLPDTTYYIVISSADRTGNRATDDGGTEPYRITTGPRADLLLVIGDLTFAETAAYENAFQRFDWSARIVEGAVPPVGDRQSGLRSYPAVWWQAGWEQYPPFSEEAQETLGRYLAGGGRLAVVSHDVAWAFGNPASEFWSAERESWLGNALKVSWAGEPSFWNIVFGATDDPISGSYLSGVSYSQMRSGGAGDEIHAYPSGATTDSVWSDNYTSGMIGLRWVDAAVSGDPDSAVWGGTKSRGVTYCFEWSRLNASVPDDYHRARILDRTLRWLIGRDHPDVTLLSYKNGGTLGAAPASIEWSEVVYGSVGVGKRRIEWSGDGGASWTILTDDAGPSPYSWDLAGVPNGTTCRIRVTLFDGGSPSLTGGDASEEDFTIALPGNDTRGPRVMAGSAAVTPNPAVLPGTTRIDVVFSDSTRGGSAVAGGEWSLGPAPPGGGNAMSGSWGAVTVAAFDSFDAALLVPPVDTVWIRGRDAGGAWGEAFPLAVPLIGQFTAVAGGADVPSSFRLHGNAPNPFNPETTVRFDLPRPGRVQASIYSYQGRLVRRLIDEFLPGGRHQRVWDGRDDRGRPVGSGVYLLRLETETDAATAKLLLLR